MSCPIANPALAKVAKQYRADLMLSLVSLFENVKSGDEVEKIKADAVEWADDCEKSTKTTKSVVPVI